MAEETGQLSSEDDGYLQLCISLEEKDLGLSVTLTVGGMLIIGALISTTGYRNGVAKRTSENFGTAGRGPDAGKSIKQNSSYRSE
jgi:hypothetical protein